MDDTEIIKILVPELILITNRLQNSFQLCKRVSLINK